MDSFVSSISTSTSPTPPSEDCHRLGRLEGPLYLWYTLSSLEKDAIHNIQLLASPLPSNISSSCTVLPLSTSPTISLVYSHVLSSSSLISHIKLVPLNSPSGPGYTRIEPQLPGNLSLCFLTATTAFVPQLGESVDALDRVGKWCLGKVVRLQSEEIANDSQLRECDNDNETNGNMNRKEMSQVSRVLIHFDGWSDKWNEWIDVGGHALAPARTFTQGYTGSCTNEGCGRLEGDDLLDFRNIVKGMDGCDGIFIRERIEPMVELLLDCFIEEESLLEEVVDCFRAVIRLLFTVIERHREEDNTIDSLIRSCTRILNGDSCYTRFYTLHGMSSTSTVSSYLEDMYAHFHSMGGCTGITNAVHANGIPLVSISSIVSLLECLPQTYTCNHLYDLSLALLELCNGNTSSKGITSNERNSAAIRTLFHNHNCVSSLLTRLNSLFGPLYTSSFSNHNIRKVYPTLPHLLLQFQLSFTALLFLQCTALPQRLLGLYNLSSLTQSPQYMHYTPIIVDWIKQHKVIDKLLQRENLHPEIVKRLAPLFRFLLRQSELDDTHLLVLWETGMGSNCHEEMQKVVLSVLADLLNVLKDVHLLVLTKSISDINFGSDSEIPTVGNSEQINSTVGFMFLICQEAMARISPVKGKGVLEKSVILALERLLSLSLGLEDSMGRDIALTFFLRLLQGREHGNRREEYLERIVSLLQQDNTQDVPRLLDVVGGLLAIFEIEQRDSIIRSLVEVSSLLDFVVDGLSFDQKTPETKSRLCFLTLLFTNSSLCMSFHWFIRIWKSLLISDGVFGDKKLDLVLKWIDELVRDDQIGLYYVPKDDSDDELVHYEQSMERDTLVSIYDILSKEIQVIMDSDNSIEYFPTVYRYLIISSLIRGSLSCCMSSTRPVFSLSDTTPLPLLFSIISSSKSSALHNMAANAIVSLSLSIERLSNPTSIWKSVIYTLIDMTIDHSEIVNCLSTLIEKLEDTQLYEQSVASSWSSRRYQRSIGVQMVDRRVKSKPDFVLQVDPLSLLSSLRSKLAKNYRISSSKLELEHISLSEGKSCSRLLWEDWNGVSIQELGIEEDDMILFRELAEGKVTTSPLLLLGGISGLLSDLSTAQRDSLMKLLECETNPQIVALLWKLVQMIPPSPEQLEIVHNALFNCIPCDQWNTLFGIPASPSHTVNLLQQVLRPFLEDGNGNSLPLLTQFVELNGLSWMLQLFITPLSSSCSQTITSKYYTAITRIMVLCHSCSAVISAKESILLCNRLLCIIPLLSEETIDTLVSLFIPSAVVEECLATDTSDSSTLSQVEHMISTLLSIPLVFLQTESVCVYLISRHVYYLGMDATTEQRLARIDILKELVHVCTTKEFGMNELEFSDISHCVRNVLAVLKELQINLSMANSSTNTNTNTNTRLSYSHIPDITSSLELCHMLVEITHLEARTEPIPELISSIEIVVLLLRGCLFLSSDPQSSLCHSSQSRRACFQFLLSLLSHSSQSSNSSLLPHLFSFLTSSNHSLPSSPPSVYNYSPSPISSSTHSTPFLGLSNPGCICYINSLLQQFFMIPSLLHSFLSLTLPFTTDDNTNTDTKDCILFQLQNILAQLHSSDNSVIDPTSLCYAFKDWDGTPTDISVQKDTHEFFNLLLDRVDTALEKSSEHAGLLKEVMGGSLSNQLVGRGSCSHRKTREEPFYCITLGIKNKQTLEQAFASFVEGELLQGENAYLCSECDAKVDTLKRVLLSYSALPSTLVVHLKRFELNFDTMSLSKLNDYCSFPSVLDVSPYTDMPIGDSAPVLYRLTGVLVHLGSASGGHYYSFIEDNTNTNTKEKESRDWYEFNDQVVRPFDVQRMEEECFGGEDKHRSAYLLFYTKIEEDDVDKPLKGIQSSVLDKILHENTVLCRNRMIFDQEYFHFIYASMQILYKETFTDTLISQETLSSASKLVISFLANTLCRSELSDSVSDSQNSEYAGKGIAQFGRWIAFLERFCGISLESCTAVLSVFVQQPDLVFECLVECPYSHIRRYFVGILRLAIDQCIKRKDTEIIIYLVDTFMDTLSHSLSLSPETTHSNQFFKVWHSLSQIPSKTDSSVILFQLIVFIESIPLLSLTEQSCNYYHFLLLFESLLQKVKQPSDKLVQKLTSPSFITRILSTSTSKQSGDLVLQILQCLPPSILHSHLPTLLTESIEALDGIHLRPFFRILSLIASSITDINISAYLSPLFPVLQLNEQYWASTLMSIDMITRMAVSSTPVREWLGGNMKRVVWMKNWMIKFGDGIGGRERIQKAGLVLAKRSHGNHNGQVSNVGMDWDYCIPLKERMAVLAGLGNSSKCKKKQRLWKPVDDSEDEMEEREFYVDQVVRVGNGYGLGMQKAQVVEMNSIAVCLRFSGWGNPYSEWMEKQSPRIHMS